MKAKLKVILYFILEFILSLVFLGCLSLFLIKSTIYNPDFVKEQFKESDYYNNLYTSINNEMSNIVVQAGLDDSALENIYTNEMLSETIDEIISSIYSGKTYEVNTQEVKENLINNINNYLEINNIKITDQEALDKFVNNILKIYMDEITISDNIKYVEKIISKTRLLINIGLILCLIMIVILSLFMKKQFKDTILAIPLIVTGLILLFTYILVTSNVIIDNIFIWDVKVSELLQQVMFSILDKVKLYGVFLIILGCIDTVCVHLVNERRK